MEKMVIFAMVAAWLTGLLASFLGQAWLLFGVSLLCPPIALLHGISVWIGMPWI